MPYDLRHIGGKVAIIRKADGKVVGHSDSMEKAQASIRARMAGENHGSANASKRGKGKQV